MKVWLIGVFLVVASTAFADKPSAPVSVRLESTAVPGGYQVRIVATPTRAVPSLELSLAGKRVAFGATAAGRTRELVVFVAVSAGTGADVIGSARAGGRNKAIGTRLGAAKLQAPKRTTIRTLPDGRDVAEVR